MTKGGSSQNNSNFDSDSNVSDDLTYDRLSSKVHKLEDVLCSQDKLLYRVFHENKDLKLENYFAEISLQSMHNDMSVQPCENCNMNLIWSYSAHGQASRDGGLAKSIAWAGLAAPSQGQPRPRWPMPRSIRGACPGQSPRQSGHGSWQWKGGSGGVRPAV
jgi:hypothetical protein